MDVARAFPALARFYLWHLDGAVRYAPAVRILRRHASRQSRILEVGSGAVGATLFLPRAVTGCDLDFTGPDLGWLARVPACANARGLPFADAQFDFVLAMDVVEHVPPAARERFIRELVRVSRGWVILSAPCGGQAQAYDARLYGWLRARTGTDHRWLREHLELGLPEAAELEGMIRRCCDASGDFHLDVLENFDRDHWLWTWKFQASRNRFWRSFKNKLLWPLTGWLGRAGGPSAYRKVFILRKGPVAAARQAA